MFWAKREFIQRWFDRIATYTPVEIRSDDGVCLADAVVRDISPKGALLHADRWEPLQTRVIVWFPSCREGMAATVKWSLGPHVGVEFDELSDMSIVRKRRNHRTSRIGSFLRSE